MEEKFGREVEEIRRRTKDLEEMLTDFRKKIVTDFTNTIAERFERMERSIEELNDIMRSGLQGEIDEIRDRVSQIEQKRIEGEEMKVALEKLAGSEKQKIIIDKKLINKLRV